MNILTNRNLNLRKLLVSIDYQVVMFDFGTGYVNEAVNLNKDGSFTIFISDSLSPEAKKDAFKHAMFHILNDDFYSEESIDEIEYRAHKYSKYLNFEEVCFE